MIIKKEDLIDALAAHTEGTKKEAKDNIEFLMQFMADKLAEGDTIDLFNYAKLEVVDVAAKTGVNPATKEKIMIPAKKKLKFTARKGLKDRL